MGVWLASCTVMAVEASASYRFKSKAFGYPLVLTEGTWRVGTATSPICVCVRESYMLIMRNQIDLLSIILILVYF